jgi:hypothetical protein
MSKTFKRGDTIVVAHSTPDGAVSAQNLEIVDIDGHRLRVSGVFVAAGDSFMVTSEPRRRDTWWIDSRELTPFNGPVKDAYQLPRRL